MWADSLRRTWTGVVAVFRDLAAKVRPQLVRLAPPPGGRLRGMIERHPHRLLTAAVSLTLGACLAWWTAVPDDVPADFDDEATYLADTSGSDSAPQAVRPPSVLPPLPELPPPPKDLSVLPAATSASRFLPAPELAPVPALARDATLPQAGPHDIDLARGGEGIGLAMGRDSVPRGAWLTGTIENLEPQTVPHATRFAENFPSRH